MTDSLEKVFHDIIAAPRPQWEAALETADAPNWLKTAILHLITDPVTKDLIEDSVCSASVNDRLLALGLLNNPNTEALFARVFEAAVSVRALATEISALRGQQQTLLAEEAAARFALNVANRALTDAKALKDEAQSSEEAASTNEKVYTELAGWAAQAESLPDTNFYSGKNVAQTADDQSAAGQRSVDKNDDGDLKTWLSRPVVRQEARLANDLRYSGKQWAIARVSNQRTKVLAHNAFARLEKQVSAAEAYSLPDDIVKRGEELDFRIAALGHAGFDFDNRLVNAASRFLTERIVLKLYVAAFIASVSIVPGYASYYSGTVLRRLQALADVFAVIGDGADLVFECLVELDFAGKVLALRTRREERAIVIHATQQADGTYNGMIELEGPRLGQYRLFRYARIACVQSASLVDVRLAHNSKEAYIGLAPPISSGINVEVAKEHFWNIDPGGEWNLQAIQMTPDHEYNTVSVVLTVGYEVFDA